MSLILFLMSLGSMSHVDFKESLCHPVEFRGQGPFFRDCYCSIAGFCLHGMYGPYCLHPDNVESLQTL